MALSKDELSAGLLAELGRFEDLLRALPEETRDAPSRCAGWSAGDVAAHVIGTMAEIVAGNLDGLGTPEVTQREVEERRNRSLKELADECAEVAKATAELLPAFDEAAWSAPAPGGYEGTLAEAVEALWFDAFVHADDIRAAAGRPTELGPGLRAAVSHVGLEMGKLGWNGRVPEAGDEAMAFVLAGTGRAATDAYPAPVINIYADA